MSTNGELRFRLNCNDGSAYIRTVTTDDSQGWQNPHFHKHLRETYIVETGWIGYIEICNGVIETKKYGEGDVFTTIRDVAHNIYMPANATIHTVKHNADTSSEETDWHGDSDDCKVLAERVSSSLLKDWSFDIFPAEKREARVSTLYPEEYRHFDNLIWQVPTWATGLFAAVVAIVGLLLSKEQRQFFLGEYTMSQVDVASVLLAFFGVFTLALAYTLFRFRTHQAGLKTTQNLILSPQTLLQILVGFEAWLLILSSVILAKADVLLVATVLALFIGILTVYWELTIARIAGLPKSSKNSVASQNMSRHDITIIRTAFCCLGFLAQRQLWVVSRRSSSQIQTTPANRISPNAKRRGRVVSRHLADGNISDH